MPIVAARRTPALPGFFVGLTNTRPLVRATFPGLGLFLVLAITALCYWPGLEGPLLLDDEANLKPLRALVSGGTTGWDVVLNNRSGILHRPIAMASFTLNALASGFDIWTFKYTNLMLHCLCGSLIFWLSGRLLRRAEIAHYWTLALLVTALWLLSPLLVSTVLYVVQRMAQLATLFSLAGLLAYTIGRELSLTHPVRGSLLFLSAFFLFTPLAALSKENGALLPALLLLTEWAFFRFGGPARVRQTVKLSFVIGLVVPYLLAFSWLFVITDHPLSGYQSRDFSLEERLLTEARILFSYLSSLLFPNGAYLGLFHDDYSLSTGLFTPWTTLPAVLLWVGTVALAYLTRASAYRYVSYGLLFFLVAHALESSIFPLELYFEHRNYLPAFGIFFALAVATSRMIQHTNRRPQILAATFLIPAFLAAATAQRAYAWQNWETIVLTNERYHPNSSRLATELASIEINRGDLPGAMRHLDNSVRLNPQNETGAYLHALVGYCLRKISPDDSLETRAPTYFPIPYTVTALYTLTDLITTGQCTTVDETPLIALIGQWLNEPEPARQRYRWDLHLNRARLLYRQQHPDEAVSELQKALTLSPKRLQPGLLIVRYMIETGDIDAARAWITQIKALDPGTRQDHTQILASYSALVRALEGSQ